MIWLPKVQGFILFYFVQQQIVRDETWEAFISNMLFFAKVISPLSLQIYQLQAMKLMFVFVE